MAIDGDSLSEEQRELVAIGATIGAGCHPCFDHHLKAAAKTGLGGERVAAAAASASSVAAEATERLSRHVQAHAASASGAAPDEATQLDRELAAFGAALGANARESIERHLQAAARLGLCGARLHEAIDIAESVRQSAGRLHLEAAKRVADSVAPPVATGPEEAVDGCGCDGDAQSEPVQEPVTVGC